MEVNELLTYLVSPVAQVVIVMGFAEIAKGLGLPSRFIPVLDVVVGIALGLLIHTAFSGMGIIEGIILGIAAGLSACGLFSGVKNVAGN